MRIIRNTALAAVGALAVLSACAKDEPTSLPTTPTHRTYTLRGRVELTGYLVNSDGHFVGNAVVENADGVEVQILSGATAIARASTHGGEYSFSGLAPGGYQVRSVVIAGISAMTRPLIITSSDLNARDTLRLISQGDLLPIPNPLPDTVRVYYEIPQNESVQVRVVTLGGDLVQTLVNGPRRVGLNQALWDGRDGVGQPASAGLYWVTFQSGGDTRAHLLFKN